MNALSPLEREVLRIAFAGDHPVLQVLRRQVAGAEIGEREMTGVGFFRRFTIPRDLPATPREHSDFEITDVGATLRGLRHGAGFVIFVRGGYLSTLEGFSFEEPWPESEEDFSVQYHSVPREFSL